MAWTLCVDVMDRTNLLGSTTARRPLYVAVMGGRPLLAPPVISAVTGIGFLIIEFF
jgi:hypothetical protein